MKTIEITKATGSLADYAKQVNKEPIIVTVEGRPTAALLPIENADVETATLSTNPQFIALIERSRARHKAEGGISSGEIRHRLGLRKRARVR
jgi:prevent-host-death family protein